MSSTVCPSCLNTSFEPLIDFGRMPRTGYFLSSPEQSYPTLTLSFEFCSHCGLIRRIIDEEETADYTEVDRKTDRQLPNYVTEIVEKLENNQVHKDDLIIEIGANDGTFLNLLAARGFEKRLAVEPSIALAKLCSEKGHQIWNTHLDESQALNIKEKWGLAKVVICRHTLEHVPNPRALLLAMRSLLDREGILFLEVPDSYVILEKLQGHELWDEHLHYFTVNNLSFILNNTGFNIEQIKSLAHRSSANILAWCRVNSTTSTAIKLTESNADVDACRSFAERWQSLFQDIFSQIDISEKPIVAIGASHLQSNFLQFTKFGQYVDFLVDDDPNKLGKYVAIPQPISVISTEQLLTKISPKIIIKTAFGYDSWMNKIISNINQKGIKILEPY